MSYALLVICEAREDFILSSRLIDRVIERNGPVWVRDEIGNAREYYGIDPLLAEPRENFIRWGNLSTLIDAYEPNRRLLLNMANFGDGFPDHEDAEQFLRFIRVIQTNDRIRQPDAVILIRDADTNDERRNALLALNTKFDKHRTPVVIAVPDPETECWELAGYEHDITEMEKQLLLEIQRELDGPHPCRDSHKLRASNRGEIRHPKNVLARLTQNNDTRVAQCHDAPFDLLKQNGRNNGLGAFLDLLRDRLIPGLFGGPAGNGHRG